MVPSKTKQDIIKKIQKHDTDTGSCEVQVALISKQIDLLSEHLKTHRKDNHSRRGLLAMVASRRAHLKYLEKKNPKRHSEVVKKLKLK